MRLWSTLIVFTAAWAMAKAWPTERSDKKLLETILEHYLEGEVLMSEAAHLSEESSVQSLLDRAKEESEYELASEEEEPSEQPVPATDEDYTAMMEETASTGFRHIYSLDMRIPTQECPDSLQLHMDGSLRLCGKSTGRSCDSIMIPIDNTSYSRVRGRVRAFQFGSPDAFASRDSRLRNINRNYVDGISITYDRGPRKHVWTYAAAVRQFRSGNNNGNTCPSTGAGRAQPGFVGDNYFCSSGNPGNSWSAILYPTPLWSNIRGDCSDCGDDDIFFCVQLSEPTTESLEVRVCTNEGRGNEDIRIESMDFYIK